MDDSTRILLGLGIMVLCLVLLAVFPGDEVE